MILILMDLSMKGEVDLLGANKYHLEFSNP
jgi:hypothetical protein